MVQAASAGPPSLRKDSTPVIANVVSLASAPAAQPTANANSVLQGTAASELPSSLLELNSVCEIGYFSTGKMSQSKPDLNILKAGQLGSCS